MSEMGGTPTLYDLIQPRDLKRKIYLVVLPVVSLAASVESLLKSADQGASVEAFARGALAAVALAGALVLWRWPRHLVAVEYAVYGLLCVGFVAQLQRALMGVNTSANWVEEMLRTSPWVPMVLILGFVIFETRRALVAVLAFYACGLVSLVLFAWKGDLLESDLSALNMLLQQFVLFNIIYVALLYVLGTLKERSLEQVVALARMDPLTEIPNRLHLREVFDEEKTRAERYRRPFVLVMIDVDHFKEVNDTHGHDVGDVVLKSVAQLLRAQARSSDKVFRWGGEEFLVLAVETDVAGALVLAERLRQSIEAATFACAKPLTASFGVAEFVAGDTLEALTRRADQALYAAKGAGRNCVRSEQPTAAVRIAQPSR